METRRSNRIKRQIENGENTACEFEEINRGKNRALKRNQQIVESKKVASHSKKTKPMNEPKNFKGEQSTILLRPRRSVTSKNPSYLQNKEDNMIEISSSSSSVSDSDSDMESRHSYESISDCQEEQKHEPIKKEKSQCRKTKNIRSLADSNDVNWPRCRPASIARKTGNPAGSKVVKSGLRIAAKQKPQQPWKKNLANYEADRKFAKGERRMKEYITVAAAYALGKIEEVSYDECYKIHEEMKRAYHEGRKIIEALEKKEKDERKLKENDSSSDDEWEEMDHFHPIIDEKIELTLEDEEEVEKDWWVVYLRQEINKLIRQTWENTHKVHLLCFMIHLKSVVKHSLDEGLVPSLMVSQIPSGYLKYTGKPIPVDVLQNLVKWFADAFRPLNGGITIAAIQDDLHEGHHARYPATRRLTALVGLKRFETDLDRATMLFCILCGLEAIVRICVNARSIQRRWDSKQQAELQEGINRFRGLSQDRIVTLASDCPPSSAEDEAELKKCSKKAGNAKSKGNHEERNYWVEYWQPQEKNWICIDPLRRTVDEPLTIHNNAGCPISYVFAIDNEQGISEVSQRYAMDCVKQEFRRRRTDTKWVSSTLALPAFKANEERKKFEQMQMREDLVRRPLPTTMSEYKNHPLYVLEKDLLKFEAIYPPPAQQKALGQLRGHNVYPRSTVFTLQGENNWLKLARSVKIDEKPYKVVKARPDPRIPAEERVDQFLDVYGYWQTEPFRRPQLENGKIPHNEYGNVYMFNDSMCPLDCVHLKLPGLIQISRKLNRQCVQAVVGWAFDGGWTHPVMDGAIVLQKDAEEFTREWEKANSGREEKEDKKRVERVYDYWRRMIKGVIRLSYVRKQFGARGKFATNRETLSNCAVYNPDARQEGIVIIDNSSQPDSLQGFSLDDFIASK
ncbi:unnamed protein product [Caenorhabditis sp. 36 PRJEB53466]|nr:unnamed protein product [Caenorhabditis sp. 36 PRJEB53466]